MICRFCGEEIEEGSLICNHCAKPVIEEKNKDGNSQQKITEKGEKQNKNKRELNNILFVLSIFLLIIGYWFSHYGNYPIIGMIILALGIIGVAKFYIPSKTIINQSNSNNILESEEEIRKSQIKMEKQKEEDNNNSIKLAIISLCANSIAIVMFIILDLAIFKVMFVDLKLFIDFELLVKFASIGIFSFVVGLVCSISAKCTYNKNKVSKVAMGVTLIIIIIQFIVGGCFLWGVLKFCIDCIDSCPD